MRGKENRERRGSRNKLWGISWILAAILAGSAAGCRVETVQEIRNAEAAPEVCFETSGETEAIEASEEAKVREPEPLILSVACTANAEEDVYEDMWEYSGHTIQIRFYPGSRLGNESELIQGVQAGTISVLVGSPTSQAAVVPELSLVDIPGLYTEGEPSLSVLSGAGKQWFQRFYERENLRLLDWSVTSYRQMTSSRAVAERVDLEGLRVRTIESPCQELFWEELGAEAVPMEFDKLYYALRQGHLDAQETVLGSMLGAGLYGVQKYVILTNHLPFLNSYVMNRELYESLSGEQREIIESYFTAKARNAADQREKKQEEQLLRCREVGMTVLLPGEELREAMHEAGWNVLEQVQEELGEKLVEEYLEMMEIEKESSR